ITTEQNGEEWWRDENFKMMFPNKSFGLKNVLYSWEGFGRTVEAMAKQGLRFRISETGRVVFWSEFRCGKPNVPWAIDGLIEATHLAALEAVKNDA
ncbi:MAG TPA: hypothetical protein VLA24_12760, partial [Pseudomonadales bacterium]|nr:hypothetical protein [Pseudomonadales bacterium]